MIRWTSAHQWDGRLESVANLRKEVLVAPEERGRIGLEGIANHVLDPAAFDPEVGGARHVRFGRDGQAEERAGQTAGARPGDHVDARRGVE